MDVKESESLVKGQCKEEDADKRKNQVVKAVTSQAWEHREPPQGPGKRLTDTAKAKNPDVPWDLSKVNFQRLTYSF